MFLRARDARGTFRSAGVPKNSLGAAGYPSAFILPPCPLLRLIVELSTVRYRKGLKEVNEDVLLILRRGRWTGPKLL